ncbi:hypothetical protein GX888_02155 [Candidatus Dojkabacteria bacterium]|uniref:GtrA/DPMS transmembrane domain-containing protein n=1 Tax=Candidatus Dojkabacteria bacterium TaxID=2099670 RepID=A0A847VDU9_9BACT|nr:hypothetical protein [Candidatus Dojkabacteria bacterium]
METSQKKTHFKTIALYIKNNLPYIMRYILISIIGYTSLGLLMLFFQSVLKLSNTLSFSLSYFLLLIFDYISNLRFVFKTKYSKNTILKYILYIVFFQFLSTGCYYLLNKLHLDSYLTSYIVMFSLFPLKYLTTKYIVFK